MDNTPTTMDAPNNMVPVPAEVKDAQKHKRNFYTRRQLELLEAYFQQYRYLDGGLKAELATRTELSQLQVKNWFQNRRNRSKPKTKLQQQALNHLQPAFQQQFPQPPPYPQLPSTPESLGTPPPQLHMNQQPDLQQPFAQQLPGLPVYPLNPSPSMSARYPQEQSAFTNPQPYPQNPTQPTTAACDQDSSTFTNLPSCLQHPSTQRRTSPQHPTTFSDPTPANRPAYPPNQASYMAPDDQSFLQFSPCMHQDKNKATNKASHMAQVDQSYLEFSPCMHATNTDSSTNQDAVLQGLSSDQDSSVSSGISTRELLAEGGAPKRRMNH